MTSEDGLVLREHWRLLLEWGKREDTVGPLLPFPWEMPWSGVPLCASPSLTKCLSRAHLAEAADMLRSLV